MPTTWPGSWKRARVLALTAGLAVLAGGCGTSQPHPSPPSSLAPGTATATAAQPVTGTQLKALFPGPAALPAGWMLSNGTGQEIDSGAALTAPPYLPALPRQSCAGWKGVDPQFLLVGDQASDAQLTVQVGRGASTSLGSIGLAGYYPGWAARQFALIESFARHRCGPFHTRDEITGARVQLSPAVATIPGLGGQALLIKIVQVNGPLPDGSYYPGDYLLVARVGSYLADVAAPAFPGRSPARAVRQVMTGLVHRLGQLG